MTTALRAGLDIGGTKIDAVALDPQGAIAARVRVPTVRGADGVIGAAAAAVDRLRELVPAPLGTLGVGIPGAVDATGRVRHAVNLDLSDLDLAGALGARVGLPVRVENDVTAAALGAYRDAGVDSLAYLNLGTGMAAGLVLGGRLWRGARGGAGEIGHLAVDPAGLDCPCGQSGCLETVASGSGVARQWPGSGARPALADLVAAAEAGDPAARGVRDRLVGGVATAVRVLVLTVDVDAVVLGGGVADTLGDRLLADVRDRLATTESPFLLSLGLPGRVRRLPDGHPAALVGAALVGAADGDDAAAGRTED